jgi:hypothetical protein
VKPGRKQAKNSRTSLASMSGAAVMLLVIEFWTGAGCLAILLFFACFLPSQKSRQIRVTARRVPQ